MDNNKKEELINNLLVNMNEGIEMHGQTIKLINFNLSDDGEDMKNFIEKTDISLDDAKIIVKTCITRGFLKRRFAYGEDEIFLTEEGQGRAISFINSDNNKSIENAGNITIGTINSNGQFQIGHGNIQMLEANFKELILKIDSSDVSENEKKEAKNKLKDFLNNPLVNTIIGVSAQTLITLLGQ